MSCQPSLTHSGQSATAPAKSATARLSRPDGMSFASNATGLSGDQLKIQDRQTQTTQIGSRGERPAYPAENGRAGWRHDQPNFKTVRAGRHRAIRNGPAIQVETQIDPIPRAADAQACYADRQAAGRRAKPHRRLGLAPAKCLSPILLQRVEAGLVENGRPRIGFLRAGGAVQTFGFDQAQPLIADQRRDIMLEAPPEPFQG